MFNRPRFKEIAIDWFDSLLEKEIRIKSYQNTGQIRWMLVVERPEYMDKLYCGQPEYDPDIKFPCWIGEYDEDGIITHIILEPEQIAAMYQGLLDASKKG